MAVQSCQIFAVNQILVLESVDKATQRITIIALQRFLEGVVFCSAA
jgi:hypothetical protein